MILCFESGGAKLVAALADGEGRLVRVIRRYRRPEQTASDTLDKLTEMGRELASDGVPLQAVSFGFGGSVRRSDGRPGPCFHEAGWDAVHGGEFLRHAFGTPVFVENDCNLAALGEAHFGAGVRAGAMLYATLGTGIGAGIVVNGRLLQSGPFGEAEIGHIVVEPDGPECPCGNRGCLEAFCSGPGLARLAEVEGQLAPDSKALMEDYRRGSLTARRVVERAAGYLAQVLGNVINVLALNTVVLGGGVMKGNQAFLDAVARAAVPFVFPLFRGSYRFVLSALEENVVCQGAAVYALQNLSLGAKESNDE
jgi:glucokinase